MDKKSKEIYSELDAFLNCIDESKRNKIPEDLRELIKSKKDETYKSSSGKLYPQK